MAKKKMLQQLDLFGTMFTEEPAPVHEEQQAITKAEESETNALQNIVAESENVIEDTRPFVFSDDKIGVKIKLKPPVQPAVENIVEESEPIVSVTEEGKTIADEPIAIVEEKEIVVEEPIVIIESVKESKPKSTTKKLQIPNSKQKTDKPKSKRGRKSFKEMDEEVGLINIPDEEELRKKLYYPIREVAAFFNVNTSLIRAWEVEFDILQPRKNRKGDRLFRVEDIKNLQIIYYLLRNKKFSVDGAKKYLKENKKKADTNQQLLQSLTKFRSFLVELKANL
jgi:DNA-binding transcriptional MerR regulator